LSDNVKNMVIACAVIVALVLAVFFMRGKKAPDFEYKTDNSKNESAAGNKAVEKNAVKNQENSRYSDAASVRIANYVLPKKLEKVYQLLKVGQVDSSLEEIEKISQGILTPDEKIIVEYTKAQIIFTHKDFDVARKMLVKFVEENPTHFLVDNAKNTIVFIDHYDEDVKKFKKFEDEIKRKNH